MALLLWLVVALLVPHIAAAQDATGPFFGVWQNVDPNDDALVRLQIFTGPNGPLDDKLGLDEAALDALRQWRFAPGSRDGKPIRTRVSLEFGFSMRGPK